MKHRELYCRMMYSMAYVFSMAIVVFYYLNIPNTIVISLAISCLVAGGFLSIKSDKEVKQEERLTTLEEEMEIAREAAAKESK